MQNPLGMNQGTQNFINFDDGGGTVNTQIVTVGTIQSGTISVLPNLPQGSIQVTAGTVVTTSLPDLPGGTVDSITDVANLAKGTITRVEGGSIAVTAATAVVTSLPDLPGGTVDLVTAVSVLNAGTITSLPNIPGGSIAVTAGTVSVSAFNADIPGGTIDSITAIPNIPGGTLGVVSSLSNGSIHVTAGTSVITSLPDLPGGTIDLVSSIGNGSIHVTAGTVGGASATAVALSGNPVPVGGVDAGGTVYGLLTDTSGVLQINGTVSTGGAGTQAVRLIDGTLTSLSALPDLPGGTVDLVSSVAVLNAGTLTTIPNIPGGTLGVVSAVSMLNAGTLTTIPNIPGGTLGVVTTVSNVSNGSIRMTVGTIATGSIVVTAGTVAAHAVTAATVTAGTVNVATVTHGTIDIGTVKLDGRLARNILSYGTTFGGTAAGYATLVGSAAVGAGTSTWVQNVSVNNPNGNITCLVGFGTALTGTSVLLKGTFGTAAGVGAEKSFTLPVNAGMTNQDLVAYISGAGTIDVNVSYFISA